MRAVVSSPVQKKAANPNLCVWYAPPAPPPIPIQIPNANLRPRRSTADYTQNYEE